MDSFQEYKVAVLGDIQKLNEALLKLQDIVIELTVEVGKLKVIDKIRSSIWGGIGGLIAATLMALLIERMTH